MYNSSEMHGSNVIPFPIPAKPAFDLSKVKNKDISLVLLLYLIEESYDLPKGFSVEKLQLYYQLKSGIDDNEQDEITKQ